MTLCIQSLKQAVVVTWVTGHKEESPRKGGRMVQGGEDGGRDRGQVDIWKESCLLVQGGDG